MKIQKTVSAFALSIFIFIGMALSNPANAEELTLGVVKSQVKEGMSQTEVIQALGSPNMVTTNKKGNESWVYDKLSTETKTEGKTEGTNQNKSKRTSFGLVGILGPIIGGLGHRSGESETEYETEYESNVSVSKKTLTVILTFDADSLVSDIKTHMTQF